MRPLQLSFAQERLPLEDIGYRYSNKVDVSVVQTEAGYIPFVESGIEALELMTKTEQSFESDDESEEPWYI